MIGTAGMLGLGAALGAAKGLEAQGQAASERKRQAAIARYSPWTGMVAHSVQDPSMLGNIATGTAIGSMGTKMFPAEVPVEPITAAENAKIDKVLAPDIAMGNAAQAAGGVSGSVDPANFSLLGGQPGSWLSMLNSKNDPFALYSK